MFLVTLVKYVFYESLFCRKMQKNARKEPLGKDIIENNGIL